MRILLLSAYQAASHRYWCQGLQDNFPEIDWQVLALPPRYFAWRVRGNPLSWAFKYRQLLEANYDLILATSMVDLACLRGLVRNLAGIPAIVYFHENQFAYPASARQSSTLEAQLVNLYSALSAECVVFNSIYNRDSFLLGVANLLDKLPDEKPAHLAEIIERKSHCIAVPIVEPKRPMKASIPTERDIVNIVWNHRWEFDKGPERLLAGLQLLTQVMPLRFHVIGQQFRETPAVFGQIKSLLVQRGWLGRWGFIESSDEYHELLQDSQIVLSTAIHDFQGLSVMEAVARGCLPMVPDRLAYTEFFPAVYRYQSSENDPAIEAGFFARNLSIEVDSILSGNARPVPDIRACYWGALRQSYLELFESSLVLV